MSGTVNISRDIWDDKAFKPEPFTEREAWMWMIMEASYKPRSKPVGKIWVETKRGQVACSVRFMCDAWGWSKSRVDRFLKRLENRDMIGTETGTGVNLITLRKYDEYQNIPNYTGTDQSEKRDSSGTAAGQQRDKPNKGLIPDVIQEKEEPKGSLVGFDEFWSIWPDKSNKEAARVAWKRLSMDDRRLAYSAIQGGWFEKWRLSKPDANPIHASTFLNKKRWTDEFSPQLMTINGGSNGQPASKSKARMDAFMGGATGTEGPS